MTHDQVADLQARMMACATYITSLQDPGDLVFRDACSLLVEAAGVLEQLKPPLDLGEPMEVIEPPPPANLQIDRSPNPMWNTEPAHELAGDHVCPKCMAKTQFGVSITSRKKLTMTCPVCGHQWHLARVPGAKWV
jgi:rubredoxin